MAIIYRNGVEVEVDASEIFRPGQADLLADAKQTARQKMKELMDEAVAPIRDRYTATERDTWDRQAAEAAALIADSNTAAPLIRSIAVGLGKDPMAYAQAVLAKVDAFVALGATVVSARQQADAAIDAATDQTAINAAVDAALAQVKQAVGSL